MTVALLIINGVLLLGLGFISGLYTGRFIEKKNDKNFYRTTLLD
jgi:hypothetical protein